MSHIDLHDSTAVVIIGSGAGGGTLAHELTRRGIKVVLLEAGKRQSTETFSQVPGEAFAQLTWLDTRTQSGNWGVARDFPALPVWHCKTVGGTTVHWTASAPRLQPWELRARTTYGNVAGASLIDWPISYEELENYYEIAEHRLGVTRRNGVPGNAIETARLLLLSASSRFPQGLGNTSGQVGRNYCHHITGFVWGIFDQPVYSWRGATLAGVVEDEVRNDPRRGFVGGYRLELLTLDLPTFPLVGLPYGWGRDFASIMESYRNLAGMFINGEDLPRSDNRVTLNFAVKDD